MTCFSTAAFAGLARVREIVCPQTLRRIGEHAFGGCRNLASLELPVALARFDVGWIAGCDRLERLVLPDGLDEVPHALFDEHDLRWLSIGRDTSGFQAPRRGVLRLDALEIRGGNDHLVSDGFALYRHEGAELLALFRACGRYRVRSGCRSIAPYAFAGHDELRALSIPATVERMGRAALARTPALTSVVLPPLACGGGGCADGREGDCGGGGGEERVSAGGELAFSGGAGAAHGSGGNCGKGSAYGSEAVMRALADCPDAVMVAYDQAVWAMSDRRARCDRMLERLADPLFLANRTRRAFAYRLRADLLAYAWELAEANDLGRFDDLADAGLLDGAAVARIVESLTPRRHAEAVAYLLALKHRRFPDEPHDYSV